MPRRSRVSLKSCVAELERLEELSQADLEAEENLLSAFILKKDPHGKVFIHSVKHKEAAGKAVREQASKVESALQSLEGLQTCTAISDALQCIGSVASDAEVPGACYASQGAMGYGLWAIASLGNRALTNGNNKIIENPCFRNLRNHVPTHANTIILETRCFALLGNCALAKRCNNIAKNQ